jgi:hypothetical protein
VAAGLGLGLPELLPLGGGAVTLTSGSLVVSSSGAAVCWATTGRE